MCAAEYMQNLYLRGDGIYTLTSPFHSWKRAPEEITPQDFHQLEVGLNRREIGLDLRQGEIRAETPRIWAAEVFPIGVVVVVNCLPLNEVSFVSTSGGARTCHKTGKQ
jgi:hypothetical protein